MKSRIINLNKTRTLSSGALTPNGVDVLEEISSEKGMFLTQSADVDIRDRIIGIKAILGKGCSSSQWKEITAEEAKAIMEEKERIILEEERLLKEQEEQERLMREEMNRELEKELSDE